MARRYGLRVHLVANSWMQAPDAADASVVEMVVVGQGLNAADDWIVEHAGAEDIVVTADIPLAARCVAKGSAVLHPTGRRFPDDDIGSALAGRRGAGTMTRGPAPFSDRDRSQFLQGLDEAIQRGRRPR